MLYMYWGMGVENQQCDVASFVCRCRHKEVTAAVFRVLFPSGGDTPLRKSCLINAVAEHCKQPARQTLSELWEVIGRGAKVDQSGDFSFLPAVQMSGDEGRAFEDASTEGGAEDDDLEDASDAASVADWTCGA